MDATLPIVAVLIALVVLCACAASYWEVRAKEAIRQRDYNARGWGEARDEANAFRRVLQVIADDDLDGNESLVAAKALGLTVPQDEKYIAAYFKRPATLCAEERDRVHRAFGGPHRKPQEEWTDNTEG